MKFFCLSLALLGASSISAIAQDVPVQGEPSQMTDEILIYPVFENNTITIVDQQRRVGMGAESVDILSEEETFDIVHPAEAVNRTAGVNIHRGSGQEHLTSIRSPVLTGGAGAGSFLYLENGISTRAAGFANVNGLFESATEFADQVEVFKGPGPAEYGSNAVHGLINVVTRAPRSGTDLTLLGSTRGYGRVTANADIGDNIHAALSLAHDEGFRDDSGFDQQKVQLSWNGEIGMWDADWSGTYINLNQETAGFLQTGQEVLVDGETVVVPNEAYRFRDIIETNAFPEAFRDGRNYRSQLKLSRNVNGRDLILQPYVRRAELRFLRHFVPGQALEKNEHSSVGLQAKLIQGPWRNGANVMPWSIGADIEYTRGSLYEFQSNPSRFSFVEGLHFDYEVDALVAAAYAQTEWSVSDKLIVHAGARGEYTRYDYETLADPGTSGRFVRAPDRVDDFFTLTPKLGATYNADQNVVLFARAARGSRAPQTTDLYAVVQNQEPGVADVETLDSLEAGVRFFRAFELTAYTMWKDNFFFRNAAGFNVVDGKTRHTGVEISFDVPVTDWLSASGNWSVSSHLYDFNDGSSGIRNGLDIDTAPNTLGTFRFAADLDGIDVALEWSHVGKYFTNPSNSQSYPGHDVFSLKAGYEVTPTLRLFGRVDNLFDERYADRADFAFGNERYFPGRPRTLFAGLTLSLD